MLHRVAGIGLVALGLMASTCWAQVILDNEGQWEEAVEEQKGRIQAELQSLPDHPWAGEYSGPYGGLMMAPEAGFAIEFYGCLGVLERDYGRVIVENNGHLRLEFSAQEPGVFSQRIAQELLLVRWGPRRYLVPAEDLIGFCNAINEGWGREGIRLFHYFYQGPIEPTKTEEQPDLPPEYLPYVLSRPIDAIITSVGPTRISQTSGGWEQQRAIVTIDRGRESGLLPGMSLHVVDPDNRSGKVVVEIVEEDRTIGTFTADSDKEKPRKGWILSTQLGIFRTPWKVEPVQ